MIRILRFSSSIFITLPKSRVFLFGSINLSLNSHKTFLFLFSNDCVKQNKNEKYDTYMTIFESLESYIFPYKIVSTFICMQMKNCLNYRICIYKMYSDFYTLREKILKLAYTLSNVIQFTG